MVAALVPILVGVVLSTVTEIQFELFGFMLALLSALVGNLFFLFWSCLSGVATAPSLRKKKKNNNKWTVSPRVRFNAIKRKFNYLFIICGGEKKLGVAQVIFTKDGLVNVDTNRIRFHLHTSLIACFIGIPVMLLVDFPNMHLDFFSMESNSNALESMGPTSVVPVAPVGSISSSADGKTEQMLFHFFFFPQQNKRTAFPPALLVCVIFLLPLFFFL